MLIAGDNLTGGEGWWAVGKDGAVLDQGLVGKETTADKDGRSGPDMEGDDGPVLGMEVAEDGLELAERFAEPKDVADDGQVDGSRRESGGGCEFSGGCAITEHKAEY